MAGEVKVDGKQAEKSGQRVVDTGESAAKVLEIDMVGERFHQLPEKEVRFDALLLPQGLAGFTRLLHGVPELFDAQPLKGSVVVVDVDIERFKSNLAQ